MAALRKAKEMEDQGEVDDGGGRKKKESRGDGPPPQRACGLFNGPIKVSHVGAPIPPQSRKCGSADVAPTARMQPLQAKRENDVIVLVIMYDISTSGTANITSHTTTERRRD